MLKSYFNREITGLKQVFTLIELLLVIAIIAILSSILLPALKRARNASKKILCVNNLKHIGLGLQGYAGDYNGYVLPPDLDVASGQTYPFIHNRYPSDGSLGANSSPCGFRALIQLDYLANSKQQSVEVLYCPSATENSAFGKGTYASSMWNLYIIQKNDNPWWTANLTCSYGLYTPNASSTILNPFRIEDVIRQNRVMATEAPGHMKSSIVTASGSTGNHIGGINCLRGDGSVYYFTDSNHKRTFSLLYAWNLHVGSMTNFQNLICE